MPDHRSGERPRDADEPSLTPLFRRLGDDLRRLVRQEIDLARTELRANAQALSRNALLLCAGLAVGLLGLVVLFAFLLVGLGAPFFSAGSSSWWALASCSGAGWLYAGLGSCRLWRDGAWRRTPPGCGGRSRSWSATSGDERKEVWTGPAVKPR